VEVPRVGGVPVKVLFMGSPKFAIPILEGLLAHHRVVGVVTQPDRPAGRGLKLKPPPVKELALAHGIPVFQPESLKREEAIAWIRAKEPDVIVVAALAKSFPQQSSESPPHGCLNVHASLLPRYRGAAPIPAAILNGDPETGITIILMDEGLDTGPIVARKAIPISPEDTAGTLEEKLSRLGAELLLEILPAWVEGKIKPLPQEGEPSYTKPVKKEEGLLDWGLPAEFLARKVRAFNPWPGAFTFWKGKLLKIWRATPAALTSGEAPGKVFRDSEGVKVACGSGALLLREIQLEGKSRMGPEEFARGQRDFVGSILTSTPGGSYR